MASIHSSRLILERVGAILSNNALDSEAISALDTLSSLQIADSSANASTDASLLKHEIDARLHSNGQLYLDYLKQFDTIIHDLESHVATMQSMCHEMQTKVHAADQLALPVLEQANEIRKQQQDLRMRQSIVSVFLDRFTLSEQEIAILTNRDFNNNVGKPLFDVMDKCERIRLDCRSLLAALDNSSFSFSTDPSNPEKISSSSQLLSSSSTSSSSNAGIDIMEATSQYLEDAYQLVFRYCAFAVRGYTRDNTEVSKLTKQAINRLSKRRDLLNQVIELLATNRSNATSTLFIEALTVGGPSGVPRPIELHAHDPIRYIGDMLAWVHQTMASEREFLESLFSSISSSSTISEKRRMIGSTRDFSKVDESEQLVRQLLDKNLEGCGRPLKLRVLQTVKSQEGFLTVYRILHLVKFYQVTMERTIGKTAYLCRILEELVKFIEESFYNGLNSYGRSLLRYIQPPPSDLSVPDLLRESISDNLGEIIKIYDSSLTDDENEREREFAPTLQACLDPAMQMCSEMANSSSSLSPSPSSSSSSNLPSQWDRTIFLMNCRALVVNTLQSASCAKSKYESLLEEQQKAAEYLIAEHYSEMLERSGLKPIIEAIESRQTNTNPVTPSSATTSASSTSPSTSSTSPTPSNSTTPAAETALSRIPGADNKAVAAALSQFSEFLSNVDIASLGSGESAKLSKLLIMSSATSLPKTSSSSSSSSSTPTVTTPTSTTPNTTITITTNVREEIHQTALRKIRDAYQRVWNEVSRDSNRYEFAQTMLVRGVDEVSVLLGLR